MSGWEQGDVRSGVAYYDWWARYHYAWGCIDLLLDLLSGHALVSVGGGGMSLAFDE